MEKLGGLDAAFLSCETPGMHMHVCGMLVLDPSTMVGEPYDHIRTMLLGATTTAPLMRKRLIGVPFGIGRPYWVDDAEFDLDRHLHRIHLGHGRDDRSLAGVLGDVASRPLRRDRPMWEIWVVEGLAQGHVALIAKMHHSTIDGIEGVSMMGRLFGVAGPEATPAPDGGPRRAPGKRPTEPEAGDQVVPEAEWQPERPPGSLGMLRRALAGRLADPVEVARLLPVTATRLGSTLWQVATRRRGEPGTVRPFTAPRTSFSATLTPNRSVAFTDVSLTDVMAVKEAYEVKVNDVVTAIVGGALRRYLEQRGELPSRPLVAAAPVSVHGRTGSVKGVTKLSLLFSSLATDVEAPVERLRVVAAANARAKEVSGAMGADTITRWAGQVWPTALSLAARLYSSLHLAEHHPVAYNVLLSNVAGPPFELSLAGARVVGTYAFGPITDGAGLNVTVISVGDRIGVGIVACPDFVAEVWDLADAVADSLDELTAAARRMRAGTSRRARRPQPA
jgi:WS/DGAT/MGAT family acyltransferase